MVSEGHGFSRAVKSHKQVRALAPEVKPNASFYAQDVYCTVSETAGDVPAGLFESPAYCAVI